MMSEAEYMTLDEVAKGLAVNRATLYYYIKKLSLEKQRFPLDKHVYLLTEDFNRIKSLKEAASRRGKKTAKEAA